MGTIMIVDDARLMRNIIKNSIQEDSDHRILEAENGHQAVELYKKEKPDIVTMDITMEEKNGVEAAKEILEYDSNAKIIMVTSLGQEKLLQECIEAGVSDYIVKPFTKERIISSVENTVNQ
ncbi:response regulator [candidate division KSB1 bacterium]|nr:response regulator [candidate division KSB1 bacterium]